VVYGLNRLSDDLDFDNQAGLDLDHLAENLAQYFHKAFGYGDASAKIQHGGRRHFAGYTHRSEALVYGRSLVAAHFSLETMMAGKMLACLERNFDRGRSGAQIKGRDFYDLLWFMQQRVQPLEAKLVRDGQQPYTVESAMLALQEKVARITPRDLAIDLLPMFESRQYIEAWLEAFHENFQIFVKGYTEKK
jgi:hypothetical protein